MADEEISCTGTVQRSLCRDGFPKIYQAKHNRNQTPNPRAPLTSNRSGRSSDSLLFRSLPGPCGPVAEMFETSRSFTAAGLSGNFTRFPFNPPTRKKSLGNQSAAKIVYIPRKFQISPPQKKFHKLRRVAVRPLEADSYLLCMRTTHATCSRTENI